MKQIFILMVCAMTLLFTQNSCKNNTYATGLKTEKELIANFIERQHINVIEEMPADSADWGEKDFVRMDGYGFDNMYFHLSKRGDMESDSVESGNTINLRYRKYTLEVISDTISYWTTNDAANPISFAYGVDYQTACSAWHAAIKYMKYNNSEATIICPSKLGFSDDVTNIIPYGYDLRIQIKKY